VSRRKKGIKTSLLSLWERGKQCKRKGLWFLLNYNKKVSDFFIGVQTPKLYLNLYPNSK